MLLSRHAPVRFQVIQSCSDSTLGVRSDRTFAHPRLPGRVPPLKTTVADIWFRGGGMSKNRNQKSWGKCGRVGPLRAAGLQEGLSSFKGITPENCVQVRKCAPQRSIDRSILRPVTDYWGVTAGARDIALTAPLTFGSAEPRGSLPWPGYALQ